MKTLGVNLVAYLGAMMLLVTGMGAARADTTTGGINWQDPAVYQKPYFYPITYGPVEATSTHKYYVNLAGGSGSTCTQTTPCTWSTVQGKPGTHGDGGGAFIYVEGASSAGSMGSPVLYGTAGNEIIIKPWPGATAPASFSGRNNWTTQIQYVIFDGGPNELIQFLDGPSNGEFDPVIYLNATAGLEDHIWFYRVAFITTNSGDWIDCYGIFTNLYFINSEWSALNATDNANQHHIYFSMDSLYGASSNWFIYNNIFRDTPGEVFELRLFENISNFNAIGNAAHDVGKLTCATGNTWGCRQVFDFSSDGNGSQVTSGVVANNLMWDIGDGCVNTDGVANAVLFLNNTCYLWGNGLQAHGLYSSAAFTDNGGCGSFNCAPGTFINNILITIGNAVGGNQRIAFPPGAVGSRMSSNACTSAGAPCNNSGGVTLNSSGTDFVSTTVTNPSGGGTGSEPNSFYFLWPVSTSGTNLSGTNEYSNGVITDYLGVPRPSSGPFSMGIFQNGINTAFIPPACITNGSPGTGVGQYGFQFYDDFCGTALSSDWTALNRAGDPSNSELQFYLPANQAVASSNLSITAKVQSQSGFNYTSSMVQWTSFSFTYGTVKVRAKMGGGTGPWPAIWLLGAGCQTTNITTPNNGGTCNWPQPGSEEIDIAEFLNSVYTQYNTNIFLNGNAGGNAQSVGSGLNTTGQYHVYELDWTSGSLVWKFDGTTMRTFTGATVPSTPMFLIINTAVGGSGGAPNNGTLPVTMQIDYASVQ